MVNFTKVPSQTATQALSAPVAGSSAPGASSASQSHHAVSVGNPADNPLGAVQTQPARERLPFEVASQIIREASQSSPNPPVTALSKVLNLNQEEVITALPTSEQRLNAITNSVAFAKDQVAKMAHFTRVNEDGRHEIHPAFRLERRHADQANTLNNTTLPVVKNLSSETHHMDRLRLDMELSDTMPHNNAARSALAVGLSRRLRQLQSSRLQNEAIDMVRNSITTTPTPSGMRLSALAAMVGAVGNMQSIETQRKVLEAVTAASHQVPQTARQVVMVNGIQREVQLSPIPSEQERVELAILLGKAIPDFHSSPTKSGDNMQHKAYKLFRNMLRDGDLSRISSAMQPVQMHAFSNASKAKIIQAVAGSLPAQPNSFRPGAKLIPPRPPVRTALVREMTNALDNIGALGDLMMKLRDAKGNVPGWQGLLKAVPGLNKEEQHKILTAFSRQMEVNVTRVPELQINAEMVGWEAQQVERQASALARYTRQTQGAARQAAQTAQQLAAAATEAAQDAQNIAMGWPDADGAAAAQAAQDQAAQAAQVAQAAQDLADQFAQTAQAMQIAQAQAEQASQAAQAAQINAAQAQQEGAPVLSAQAVQAVQAAQTDIAQVIHAMEVALAPTTGRPAPDAPEQPTFLSLQDHKAAFIPSYQALADALPGIKDTALRSNLSAHLAEFNQALPEEKKVRPSPTGQG